jgi:recombination protein RecT
MPDPKTAVVQKKRDVRDMLNSPQFKEEIAKVLPKHLTPERMTRVALTAFLKTPTLLDCTPESLTNALLVCSQAGLEPDGRLAHLIPYGTTVQVIFDYKGLVALAIRNGMEAVFADKVCEDDVFEAIVVNGVKMLTHKPDFRKGRGEAVCYYAVCQRNKVTDWEVMTKEEVDAIRGRSRAKNGGPWVTDYDEMAKKTVLRRMSKRWDLLPEIRDIINADDDVPTGMQEVKVSRPLFESPRLPDAKAENAAEPEPTQSASEQPQPEPSSFNALKAVRNLCKEDKISEGKMLQYLSGSGATDGSAATLEEVDRRFEGVLKSTSDNWKTISTIIKGGGQ